MKLISVLVLNFMILQGAYAEDIHPRLKIGKVRAVYLNKNIGARLIVCYDYRINFDPISFGEKNQLINGGLVPEKYIENFDQPVDFGSISVYGTKKLAVGYPARNGWTIYYTCASGEADANWSDLIGESASHQVSRDVWRSMLFEFQNSRKKSLKNGETGGSGSEKKFFPIVDSAFSGGVWLTPVFLKKNWFSLQKRIKFPPEFLKFSIENLELARKYDYVIDCGGLSSEDWGRCEPTWLKDAKEE